MKTTPVMKYALLATMLLVAGYFIIVQHGTEGIETSGVQTDPLARRETGVRERGSATDADTHGSTAVNDAADPKSSRRPAADILVRLAAIKITPEQPLGVRQLLLELERLREAGTAALPEIRAFLASGADADFDAPLARSGFRDGKVPASFIVPPSLRLGLLEVVKNIGGPEAQKLLAQELKSTGRGVEAAYLAGALEQLAPAAYRDASLAAARDLLAMPLNAQTPNPLDRSDREYLYAMLLGGGDRSQVSQAQTQLLLPNGQVDRGALRYLQQTMGDQVVAIAARAWEDPRVEPSQREPLARAALAYVGTNATAEQLYQTAINDRALPDGARKNLIEDLNETGFADSKRLTAADLPLIQKRLALIEQLAPRAMDRTNAAAFGEAKKDLLNMRDSLLKAAPAKK